MVTISKEANPNYLAKIISLSNFKEIEGADRIKIAIVDFQDVVVNKDMKEGEMVVYFPVESKINKDFLSYTNSFRNKELNVDKEKTGFFEDKGRVRAMSMLQGKVKSCGYIVPIQQVADWAYGEYYNIIWDEDDGKEFDTINGKKICEKYVVRNNEKGQRIKQGKAPKVSRLIDGQVHLHVDSENYRRNVTKINPEDLISVSYKVHGTSATYQKVLVKKSLTWVEKLLKKFGASIVDQEYDLIITSRRVVKNKNFKDDKNHNHYYDSDIWSDIADVNQLSDLPNGYSIYGEIVGYTFEGKPIQGSYDYGCTPNGLEKNKFFVYRITHTNPEGIVTELTMSEIEEFCERMNLEVVPVFYKGYAKDLYKDINLDNHWKENFLQRLEQEYLEKDCYMCNNKVPA
ncbi:MAG: hypothetical protein KC414_10905, partial [Romboutsia sp.]|nr:hypothetical protein [Romboutsia sp.]